MNDNIQRTAGNQERGFWWLFVTQFQGAFSDNVLKWLVISLITGMEFSNDKRDQLVGLVGALFALPFILFSMAGGYFADRCAGVYRRPTHRCHRRLGCRPCVISCSEAGLRIVGKRNDH